MEYAIHTENLVKQYNGDITALAGISLSIEKGDVVGYLGPNGAGKTTTIKILTSLIKPTSGKAYINGIDVSEQTQAALWNIGALIEVPGIYDYLTPQEMLSYFGKIYRMDNSNIDHRVKDVLTMVNLSEWAHKKTGTFSTGMQRRLAIAKAILHKPQIVILDEPALGLDPEGIRDIRELIRKFNEEGMTVFLSSHLLWEVAEVCNKLVFVDHGNIIASDSIENINKKIECKSIKVKFSKPLLQEEIEKIQLIESVKGIEIIDDMVRIKFDGKPDESHHILRDLTSLNFNIISYDPESMNLEDYYMHVMTSERGVN
jgi:ABC-2 type transport system ATP-binding protein